ncbi:spore germination protein [Paenibacillus sp. FSL P4-0113]|uniref:spore germination protein n=1 Tax=Paenibacillus sp. FSL P4-0113 TaxID=2921630 RepID=UPI0030FBF6B0
MFEQLSINLNLIRKQIVTPSLVVRYFMWDLKSRTKIVIVYVQDLANPELVKAVKTRIKAISSDMAAPCRFYSRI